MKSLFMAITLLLTGHAWAGQPTVSCHMSRDQVGPIDFNNPPIYKSLEITREAKSISVKGIQLTGSLIQVCAQNSMGGGGAPCFDSYNLNISLSSGEASSSMNTSINEKDSSRRFSTSLVIGQERAYVNCDVN